MLIKIKGGTLGRIKEFYCNAKKAYPSLDSKKTTVNVRIELQKVGTGQLQKTPQTLPKWSQAGYTVEFSRTTNWYFAYKIENGCIYVYGAEHANNMSNNSYVANTDQKTDGNYSPQQQFVTDNKKRPHTIIISERQFKLIKEMIQSNIKEGLPKEIVKQIYSGKTSLGDNPAFPPEDEMKFEEKLLLPAYEKILSEINTTYPNLNRDNLDEFKNELSKLLKQCQELENPIKNELESLVMKIVQKIFDVTEEDVDLTIEIVSKLTPDDIKMSLLPEIVDDIEFDGIEDYKGLNDDVYKRRVVNCLMQGVADRFIHLYEFYVKDIFELNPDLLSIYKRIIVLNEYINFMTNANKIDEESITFGSTSDIIVKSDNKSSIVAKGMNFIALLHETIRAMLDLISVNGLPDDTNKMKYVLKKADFRYATYWDMRFGKAMWMKIEEKLAGDSEDAHLLPYLFFCIVSKPTPEFNVFMQNVFANTKQGRIEVQTMMDGIRYKLDQDNFESDLNRRRDVIGDEKYFTN